MTLDKLAEYIYGTSYHTGTGENVIRVEDLANTLGNFLSIIFCPFDKDRFIRKCRGRRVD